MEMETTVKWTEMATGTGKLYNTHIRPLLVGVLLSHSHRVHRHMSYKDICLWVHTHKGYEDMCFWVYKHQGYKELCCTFHISWKRKSQ